jgi:phytoene/squalene synthetase
MKDKTGGLSGNKEWGSKARKEEDDLRGRNNSARRQTIEEQVDDYQEWMHEVAKLCERVPETEEPPLCQCGKHYVGATCHG